MQSERKPEAAVPAKKDERIVDRFYKFTAESDITNSVPVADAIISYAEFAGDRSEQEDTYTCNSDSRASATAQFKYLKPSAQQSVLQNLFSHLNNRLKNHESGATACMTIAWREDIAGSESQTLRTFTVNQGDASAFFVRANEKNEVIATVRLNQHIHDPESINHNSHVNYDYGPIARLGTVAVARALGNKANAPLSADFHVADIQQQVFIVNKTDSVFIINACDGLTEALHNLEDEAVFRGRLKYGKNPVPAARFHDAIISYQDKTIALKQTVKKIWDKKAQQEFFIFQIMQAALQAMAESKEPLEGIAYHLAQWGYILSNDNITTLVTMPGKVPVFTAVFDGHGGKEASHDAAVLIEAMLRAEVRQQYQLQWQNMIAGLNKFSELTVPQLAEPQTISQVHVCWLLSQLVQIETLVRQKKKSSEFFVAVNPHTEAQKLNDRLLSLYFDEMFFPDDVAKSEEVFFKLLETLLQTWDGICESFSGKTEIKEAKFAAPVTTTDVLNVLYCNSGSCLFQHKIGCLLQSLAAICRQSHWKGKAERDVLKTLMQTPAEPVLKNAGFMSSIFGLKW